MCEMCFEQRKSFKERIANKKQSFFEILSMEIHPTCIFIRNIISVSSVFYFSRYRCNQILFE